MPNWNQVLREIKNLQRPDALDVIRRRYLKRLQTISGRNIIAYYSGWLQKPGLKGGSLNDNDINGFMNAIHNMDRSLGLDLILHTPGGEMGATESLVNYLHSMFGRNIRAIIPQLAMSAGTMIACACREIIMGAHSSLGPIDPQYNGYPASGVIEEFEKAKEEITNDPSAIPVWQVIIGKYQPTFIGECAKAMEWSKDVVTRWLSEYMFKGNKNSKKLAKDIVKALSDHSKHKSHDRHINIEECKRVKLKVTPLEGLGDEFQDLVLTVHHSYMHTFAQLPVIKIIENHKGVAMVHMLHERRDMQ